MAYEQVDLAGISFRDFIDNKSIEGGPGNFSFVLRAMSASGVMTSINNWSD